MLPTATSSGEAHGDMGREKQSEKGSQIETERESGRQRCNAKKKSRGENREREGAREKQHSGYGFHHSEGCWLRVGEWEASMGLAVAMLCLLVRIRKILKGEKRSKDMGWEEEEGGWEGKRGMVNR